MQVSTKLCLLLRITWKEMLSMSLPDLCALREKKWRGDKVVERIFRKQKMFALKKQPIQFSPNAQFADLAKICRRQYRMLKRVPLSLHFNFIHSN